MPFITKERRDAIKEGILVGWQPGDFCYIEYKAMVEKWKANPRWTTAHNIYKEMTQNCSTAKDLAWQVFFIWYVVPYEKEKEKLNGQIE